MKSAATSRARRKKREDVPERRVARLHQPAEMSLEAWQRQLRAQFGSEQPFQLENVGEHPVFSDFRVTNPTRGSVYRVAIRAAAPGRNFCSCPDFRTNSLGTCKHIEFTVATLLARRGANARSSSRAWPQRSNRRLPLRSPPPSPTRRSTRYPMNARLSLQARAPLRPQRSRSR